MPGTTVPVIVCSKCRFYHRYEVNVREHCQRNSKCHAAGAEPQVVYVAVNFPCDENTVPGIPPSATQRVPSGIGSNDDAHLEVRAQHLRNPSVLSEVFPSSVCHRGDAVMLFQLVYEHAWGKKAPQNFRTIWSDNIVIYNLVDSDTVEEFSRNGERKTVELVALTARAITRILKVLLISLGDHEKEYKAIYRILASLEHTKHGMSVFDKLENTEAYHKHRKVPMNAAILATAKQMSKCLRESLKKSRLY